MGIQRSFFFEEDEKGNCLRHNIAELDGAGKTILRVFPIDQYDFPEEVKRQASEWHVLKVPLLGQRVTDAEDTDWCGRTSASMAYNYYQLIKGGDPRQKYITHSRAGDAECKLDLRYPGGERVFMKNYADDALRKRGWTVYCDVGYEVGGEDALYRPNPDGGVPIALDAIFPSSGPRPVGLGGILGYKTQRDDNAAIGNLLPDFMRHEADDILQSEARLRERFSHIIDCLRANNPVVIYTGLGNWNRKHSKNPIHIVLITGYCVLRIGSEDQLWLVVADPSGKSGLLDHNLSAPRSTESLDLGAPINSKHQIFRMRAGLNITPAGPLQNEPLKSFASYNLVRARTFFQKNTDARNTIYDRFLDHATSPRGQYSYREKRIEVPPEALDSSFSRPKYSLPLRGNSASTSPWQGFHNNESLDTGIGGYYVLGLQRNLHGGIHLFPPGGQKLVPVTAALPGYVVAARLPGDKAPSLAEGLIEAFGNWPGFVLVRHGVEEVLARDAKGTPRKGTFYSLYMHLSSPDFTGAREKQVKDTATLDMYFQQVPWFRSLYKRRFGAWANITGEGAEPGALRWANQPVSEGDQKPATAGGGKLTAAVLADNGAPEEITVRDEHGRVHWLYKPPQANLVQALAALEEGKVVTFSEPFFPLQEGEVLGLLRPLPGHKSILHGHLQDFETDANAPGFARKSREMDVQVPFMHFQVFCPAGGSDNGIQLLMDLARTLDTYGAGEPKFTELKSTDDNFLEVKEIEQQLTQALPAEDRAAFTKATSKHFAAANTCEEGGFGYAPAVANFLDQNTSFAPLAPGADWETCHRFTYPLTFEVETVYLPPPEKNALVSGGRYELEVIFEQAVGDDWKPLPSPEGCGCGPEGCKPARLGIDAKKLGSAKNGVLSFSLMVPALAERMSIRAGAGFLIDQSVSLPGADGRMLVDGMSRRWRNVRLIQKNEWIPDNATTVLAKLLKALDADGKTLAGEGAPPKAEDVAEISWCDPAKEAPIHRLIEEKEAEQPALFSDSGTFAPGGLLDNLHPITSVWLLNVLDKQRKALVRNSWAAPGFRKEDPRPRYFGWVDAPGTLRLGDSIQLAVIDEDYGYDKDNRVTVLARQGSRTHVLAASRPFSPGGNIVQPHVLSFWGDWTLELTDTSTPPKALSPQKPLALLRTDLSIPRPKVQGALAGEDPIITTQPLRLGDGSWRWFLPFEEPAPRELHGFISLRLSETLQGPGVPQNELMLPAVAHPVSAGQAPAIDSAMFVLDEAQDFIVGLSAKGQAALKKSPDTFPVLKDVVSFKTCTQVMDIRVGWGIVQGLLKLKEQKVPFTLKKIDADGLTCTLYSEQPDKVREVLQAQQVTLSAAPAVDPKVAGKKGRKLSEAEKTLQATFPSARCEDPQQQASWLLDGKGEFILGPRPPAKTPRLGALAYAEYDKASRPGGFPRIHVMLVAALGQVAALTRKLPPLLRLEAGGLTCVLDVSGKGVADRVREAAAQAGTFEAEVDPADPKRLRLTAQPGRENWLCLNFRPGRLFDLLAQGELPPGAERFYWFDFTCLSGQPLLHPFVGETTGSDDGGITRARFEELKAQASDSLRVSHPRPEFYRKVGLRPMNAQTGATLALKPVPLGKGQCMLEISACVSGTPEDLSLYVARFSRSTPSDSKQFKPLKDFAALRPRKLSVRDEHGVADWLVSARVPFPFPENNKKSPLEGTNSFKLELLPAAEGTKARLIQVEATYDFTPRWVGGLKVEQKGERVELRCHAEGIQIPRPGIKDSKEWGGASEFELVIEPDLAADYLEALADDPTQAAVALTQDSKSRARKLSDFVQYATPSQGGKRGGCDVNGDFVATLPIQAFAHGARHRFSVRRPRDPNVKPKKGEKEKSMPVRLIDMAPCEAPGDFSPQR